MYSTIVTLLDRVEYIGHAVTNKGYSQSYKTQLRIINDKDNWLIFENAHEPIVPKEIWDVVRKRRSQISRKMKSGLIDELSGMIFCADCGRRLYAKRTTKRDKEYKYYTCSGYKNKENCTTHYIQKNTIEKIILNDLQNILSITKQFEDTYLLEIMLNDISNELDENDKMHEKMSGIETRLSEIDGIIKKLYEDSYSNKITTSIFNSLSKQYDAEREQLSKQHKELSSKVQDTMYIVKDKKDFLHLVRKYTEITELNYDIVRELIDRIEVHDKTDDGSPRKIDIYYRFAGKVDLLTLNGEHQKMDII